MHRAASAARPLSGEHPAPRGSPPRIAVAQRYIYLPIFTASLHSRAYLSVISTSRIDGLGGAHHETNVTARCMRHCRFTGACIASTRRRPHPATPPAAGTQGQSARTARCRSIRPADGPARRPARRHRQQCARTCRLAATGRTPPSVNRHPRHEEYVLDRELSGMERVNILCHEHSVATAKSIRYARILAIRAFFVPTPADRARYRRLSRIATALASLNA
ncbi:hypothetical protein BST28156_05508 [Burkholderia stagnalis]|nr:hypothetical protein BST28156_05508 [Burkholderia stagnalis]